MKTPGYASSAPVRTGPTAPAERIVSVDVLRGLAILGILLMNISSFSGQTGGLQAWSEPLDRGIYVLTRLLVEAKFYSLFSLLFGWGMALQIRRAEAQEETTLPRLLRRLSILFLMGVAHAVFLWSGDILAVYALCGAVLLLLRNRSNRTLLTAMGVFILAAILIWTPGQAPGTFRSWYAEATDWLPFDASPDRAYSAGSYWTVTGVRIREFIQSLTALLYTFGKVFSMFLLGFFFGRRRVFTRAQHDPGFTRPLLWTGLTLGLILNMIYVVLITGAFDLDEPLRRFFANAARTIGAPLLMLAYVAGLLHLMQRRTWSERLNPFATVGRMALTNYILQSIAATTVFYGYGLGLYGRIDPSFGLLFSLALFAGQVRFSQWWLERHRFGPLEWAWRSLTYRRVQKWHAQDGEAALPDLKRFLGSLSNALSPTRLLAVIWLAFALWGAGLIYWDARLDRDRLAFTPSDPVAAPEAGPEFLIGSAPTEEIGAREPVPTPILNPPAYEPATILADGSLYRFGQGFDVEAAYDTIETITTPPYSGRQAGTPGGHAAGEYIAQQFAEFGLQPAGEGGSYFQPFSVETLRLSSTPSLQIRAPGGDWQSLAFLDDFAVVLRRYAGEGSAAGWVVWANNCTHDDFDAVTVVDQIVFCREAPGVAADREALEHGASGLLLLIGPEAMPLDFAWPHHQPLVPEPIPTLRVSGSAATVLLEGSGWTLNDLSLAYSSTPLVTEVRMEVTVAGREACSIEGCIGRNVLGVLPGRDPEYADEIVVLGAHYDHMGETPGGAVWAGANDNASGVAVLLEIARMWHENGYAPRRTVLFAAWDAEELGLIGSRRYVEHPIFPLDSTVAMLQLDMVGAGTEQLYIDGGGALEPILLSLADQLGLETSTTNHGRSDHGPFLRAGVPANLLIWFGGDDSVLTYHRPVDVAGNIEIPKLDAAGKLTHLALLSLAEVEPAVQELLAQRAGALGESNLQAFLATSSEARIAQDATWFTSFASLQPMQVELWVDSLHVYPGGAVGRVFLDFDRPTADGEGSVHETIDWPVRFEYAAEGWRWAGPDLRARTPAAREGTELFISHNPKAGGATEALERLAAERYAAIAGRLGFVAEKDVHLQLFESSAALRASTHFDVPDGTTFWAVPGAVKLVHPVDLEDTAMLDHALIHLLLLELGFPHGRPIWLWEGLPLLFDEVQTPYEVQTAQLVQLQEDLQEQTPRSGPAASWAAASALRETLAWESFGFALRQSGAICRSSDCLDDGDLDAALLEGFGMNSQAIQEYGLRVWRERLEAAQRELDDLMARRSAAWRSGDLAAFLNTVDASTPGLLVEQRLWFKAREHGEVQSLTFDAQPVFFTEDGLQADVTVMLELLDAEGASSTKPTRFHGRFRRTDQGLVWAGAPYESTQRPGILVLFPQGEQQLALRVLSLSGPILEHVPGTLGLPSDLTYQVKIFTDEDAYQASLPPPSVSPTGLETWTQPGTTIKLYVPGGRASPELESVLGKALIRSALLQSGVDSEWLLRGLSLAFSSEFDDGWSQSQTAQQFFELIKSEQGTLRWALDQLPAEEELNREQNARVDALAWDTLRYLRRSYGDDALRDLLIRLGDEDSLRTALKDVTGLDPRAFQAAWWDSFTQGHTDPRWIEWMMAFQEQAVMADIEYLSGEAFAGRRAGSPESELAAAWIADQFKAYGLEPVVAIESVTPDSMPPSSDADTDEPVERVKSYFQPVPLVYTELTSAPTLQFTSISSDFSERLAYKSEFTLPVDVLSGRGSVEGTLVWVLDETYGGMDLSGKVVMRPQVEAAAVEVQRAMEHGAAGLIIAGDAAGVIETLSKTPLPAAGYGQVNIPVLVLTEPGFEKLRKALEITVGDLYNGPPAQVLGVEVQMQVPLTPPVETTSPNVLGLIEGSNPQLADQVVLLSAHYDHVGDEPAPGLCAELAQSSPEVGDQACSRNGLLRYPGANDDASGVAVLLEIARLWQASGYRPQRSVLFAVWTAQEPGELGSGHFIQNPPLPLENLHAVLHLDAVGGGTGYYLEAHYDWDLDAEPLFHLFTTEDLIEGRLARSAKPIHNDHSAFRDQGVPALILTWRGAYERNMPLGYDDPLEPSRLGISGRMVGLTAMMLAR